MPKNKNLNIECFYIKKGTREEDGAKLVIVKIIVEEKEGDRKAIVYLGKPADDTLPYMIKGNLHLQPFNGQNAADAACSKAKREIDEMDPREVFGILAKM